MHDSQILEYLVHGEKTILYGDKAYASEDKQRAYETEGIDWCINHKARRGQALSQRDSQCNRKHNRIRSKGKHTFLVVKHLWGYRKVRYKGMMKNATQVFSLIAPANLYMVRKDLLLMQG